MGKSSEARLFVQLFIFRYFVDLHAVVHLAILIVIFIYCTSLQTFHLPRLQHTQILSSQMDPACLVADKICLDVFLCSCFIWALASLQRFLHYTGFRFSESPDLEIELRSDFVKFDPRYLLPALSRSDLVPAQMNDGILSGFWLPCRNHEEIL